MTGWVPAALAGGFVGAALGWFAVPWLADVVLKRARRRFLAWWWDSYEDYRAFKEECGHEPLAGASGREGALGIWRDDAVRAACSGGLASERAEALAKAGLSVDGERAGFAEDDAEARCSFSARLRQRAVLAAAGAVLGCAISLAQVSALALAALAACVLAMAVATVCDVRARMLPLECCWALAAAGAVFQLAVAGWEGLAAGAVFGGAAGACCLAANRFLGKTGAVPVGWGDVRCMVALSLATGAAAPVGFAACYVASAAWSLAGVALRKLTMRDGIPMAPFCSHGWRADRTCLQAHETAVRRCRCGVRKDYHMKESAMKGLLCKARAYAMRGEEEGGSEIVQTVIVLGFAVGLGAALILLQGNIQTAITSAGTAVTDMFSKITTDKA